MERQQRLRRVDAEDDAAAAKEIREFVDGELRRERYLRRREKDRPQPPPDPSRVRA